MVNPTGERLFAPSGEQAVLAEFIAAGHFARHIRRMRVLYEARRDALCDALGSLLGDVIEIGDARAGMQLVGWLRRGASDRRVAELARGAGLVLAPLQESPAPSATSRTRDTT